MRDRRGVVLLEVLIALAILALAGLSLASVVREQSQAIAELADRREILLRADQAMARLALRGRPGLDLRLGRRLEGRFLVDVERPRRDLYRLALADSAAPAADLLVTVVYRPEPK